MTDDVRLARTALLCMIDNERVARGVSPLAENAALDQASQLHADDMVARDYKNATAPDPAPNGKTPDVRAYNAGYPATNAIGGWSAWNRTDTPRDLMAFFLRRGGDCSSMADPVYADIGLGIATASDGARLIITWGGAGTRSTQQAPKCPANVQTTPAATQTQAQQVAAANAFASQPPSQIATQLGLPSAKRCQSRRAFTIRVKEPLRLRAATVSYGGNRAQARRIGGRLRALVDLRGYSRGTVVVRIDVTTAVGVKARGTRKYKTCAARRNF